MARAGEDSTVVTRIRLDGASAGTPDDTFGDAGRVRLGFRAQPVSLHGTDDGALLTTTSAIAMCAMAVTGRRTTHVAFFRYGDVKVDHPEKIARVPFNKDNPDGPLEICLCTECNAVLMLDDRLKRIRVGVPDLMGYGEGFPEATYHAFWDESKGYPKPDDGRPVYPGLRPDFTWPQPAG